MLVSSLNWNSLT